MFKIQGYNGGHWYTINSVPNDNGQFEDKETYDNLFKVLDAVQKWIDRLPSQKYRIICENVLWEYKPFPKI